jgi:hypothetical protein
MTVLQNLARILSVTLDSLCFDEYAIAEAIQDKELVSYLARIDVLDRRERTLVKDFLDSVLARAELEQLKRTSEKARRAA